MNLRFRLILLVMLAVIPILVITFVSGMEQRALARKKAVDEAYRLTRLVSAYQASLVETTRQFLSQVAIEEKIWSPQTCQPYVKYLNQIYSEYSVISVVDEQGNVFCSSAPTLEPINISDRDYFQRALQSGSFVYTGPVTGRQTEKFVFPFALAVSSVKQQKKIVLVASVDLYKVLDYAIQMNLQPKSAVLLVDQQGTVLLRYPETETWAGKSLPNVPIIRELLASRGEGNAETQGVDGITRLYAFTPLLSTVDRPLYVSIGIPTEIAYRDANRLMQVTLTWIAISALIALVVAWFAGDALFLRIVSLTAERDAAEKKLLDANALLEERVSQRTEELARVNSQLGLELAEREKMVELLRQRETALNKMVHLLEQSNRDLQDFAYIASHDLQEPLRKIQAFGDRLIRRYANIIGEEGSDIASRMISSANRMQAMINDLLSYSRVATNQRPFEPVDLNLLLCDILSDLEVRLQETKGQVLVDPLPPVEADPVQMRQLLANLVTNALKFHRPGVPPVVHVSGVSLPRAGDGSPVMVELSVQDNGIGFDEKYLQKIFQPFQRLHSRDSYEGSGVGLAICRRIVERHNGDITATSIPGEGSRFMVIIPQTKIGREIEDEIEKQPGFDHNFNGR